MLQSRIPNLAFYLILNLLTAGPVFAKGGTGEVATKGQSVRISPVWPEGFSELVNHKSRTSGWNSWFSEWPNDVNQYAIEIKSTNDLNGLITKLAAIKTDLRQIRLSHLKEPSGLGWVTRVPEGNGIPVILSIGNQAQIDEWFKHVRKPFGVMEFTAAPVAIPPTLTIFVQNEVVNVDELEIPGGIDVSSGCVPRVFHKFNTTVEAQREKDAADRNNVEREKEKLIETLDEPSLVAFKKIEVFLDSRKGRTKR